MLDKARAKVEMGHTAEERPMTDQSKSNLTRRALLGSAGAALYAQTTKLPSKVRVGIVGLVGHPGEISKPLDTMPDVEVVAIADPDPGAIQRFTRGKARLAGAKVYTNYR